MFDGRVTIARPLTVVANEDDSLVMWLAPGSVVAVPNERVPPYSGHYLREWHTPGLLQRVRAGEPWSLGLLRTADDRFAGWYVNLQEPLRWTDLGYDTRDNLLDLWHAVDGEWTWKDEDELADAVQRDALSEDEADAIRAAAERAIRELELPTGWEHFEPDASWPVPRLPEGWDALD